MLEEHSRAGRAQARSGASFLTPEHGDYPRSHSSYFCMRKRSAADVVLGRAVLAGHSGALAAGVRQKRGSAGRFCRGLGHTQSHCLLHRFGA
jgi:hypothetical protein